MALDDGVLLCRVDDLPTEGARGFDPQHTGRDTMFLVRRGDRISAWVNACPHVDGAPLAWRKDAYLNAGRSAIVCYGHGAVFDIDSGLCTSGPCVGQALTAIPLAVDSAGAIRLSPRQQFIQAGRS
jgi:nitrite reductase/ring-hydroxylating ferredoxin subunit